jgi:hypothetical protein
MLPISRISVVAINLMAADYQAAAGDSTARRSSAIPINMIFWAARRLAHMELPTSPTGNRLRFGTVILLLSDFYRGAKYRELYP